MSHFEVLVQIHVLRARRLLARTGTDASLQRQIYKSSCNENGGAADENVILPPLLAYLAPSYYLRGPCGISDPCNKELL